MGIPVLLRGRSRSWYAEVPASESAKDKISFVWVDFTLYSMHAYHYGRLHGLGHKRRGFLALKTTKGWFGMRCL